MKIKLHAAALIFSMILSLTACGSGGSNAGMNASAQKYTFIMIHFEAGYKACKVAGNLPPGLSADVCAQGWQEYFWQTATELVDKANEYGFKLTLAFTPQWGEFIANDAGRLELVRRWKTQGHEIGFQHHSVSHIDWDGYSNEDIAKDINYEYHHLYLGPVGDGFSFVNALSSPDPVVSSTMGGLPFDFPALMNSPTVIYGSGTAADSYPQLGDVKSLRPTRYRAVIGGIERDVIDLTMRAYTTAMDISLDQALPVLQEQYRNLKEDEVFGIVWHEYDHFKAKDLYMQWFDFIKEQGNSVKTMKEIADEYFK